MSPNLAPISVCLYQPWVNVFVSQALCFFRMFHQNQGKNQKVKLCPAQPVCGIATRNDRLRLVVAYCRLKDDVFICPMEIVRYGHRMYSFSRNITTQISQSFWVRPNWIVGITTSLECCSSRMWPGSNVSTMTTVRKIYSTCPSRECST